MRAVWAEDAWFEPLCGLSIYGRNPRLVSRVSRQGRISTIAFFRVCVRVERHSIHTGS